MPLLEWTEGQVVGRSLQTRFRPLAAVVLCIIIVRQQFSITYLITDAIDATCSLTIVDSVHALAGFRHPLFRRSGTSLI